MLKYLLFISWWEAWQENRYERKSSWPSVMHLRKRACSLSFVAWKNEWIKSTYALNWIIFNNISLNVAHSNILNELMMMSMIVVLPSSSRTNSRAEIFNLKSVWLQILYDLKLNNIQIHQGVFHFDCNMVNKYLISTYRFSACVLYSEKKKKTRKTAN